MTQNENRQIFGATYMTMNNPYYQVLDSKLRSEIEERGDVLLTRDAAMDQRRQNEEIEELINAGAKVIFLTPVEWEESEEGLTTAEKAGVPVIVVDAPVQATDKVACSIVSDNYQAGVLCAKHLLKHKDSGYRASATRLHGIADLRLSEQENLTDRLKTRCRLWKIYWKNARMRIPLWHSMIQVRSGQWRQSKVPGSQIHFPYIVWTVRQRPRH